MLKTSLIVFLAIIILHPLSGQEKLSPDSAMVNDIQLRNIGPARASGRIADFAINPKNPFEFYVAVASGHIWKTNNNGTTWEPVFDNYGVYAIGCLAIDKKNPNVVWAGTGENNSQRALGFGNGVYKSVDAGKSWKNMGLKQSMQIGKILIDPRNSNNVFVAAEGSVWGPGGERGIYRTTDGGKSWKQVLEISENTGAYDLEFHPCNPEIIYATVHQRRRRAYSKINGGPESAFYKSTDGGLTWKKSNKGLPGVHLGRIGLSVTPAQPSLVYAIVEAANGKGGFYKSTDEGESWNRMSDYTSSGQYYTTIYADPNNPDKIYSMDTWSSVSNDGGKTWKNLSTKHRHVDDHALWIDPILPNHIRIGGDGGVYESYDDGNTWNFSGNLPVTQFYRVNVDNSEPFYYVYGGTQDNNTLGGPSQNLTSDGVSNDEWFVTLGGDGFWVAVDPENPNIVYSEYQYGNLYRYNRANGETVYIKPQEAKGELTYKWNWDAPMILSPHSNTRLYIAANKVFVSEDRGNSWTAISGDLTTQKDRNDFKVMGKYWSGDAVAKDVSTSQWGTLVSFAESSLKEGLLYTGSDDGLIHITDNNGQEWRKAGSFPNVPEFTHVSDICPSRFNENIVFASFNNHKSNDFKPYILMSKDKGKSWTSIASNLPDEPIWTIAQDIKDPNLLFVGTECGLYVSFNKGKKWMAIKNGLPSIAVRDIVIQERENDLVLATFGRGFYILHNYSHFREISKIDVNAKAEIFPVKDAKLYIPQYNRRSSYGDDFYIVKNQPFGAEFTYYLKDDIKTDKQIRQKEDGELFKEGAKINVNTYEEDRLEKLEEKPYLLFVIEDSEGNIIRKITAKANKGIHRIYWDLKYPGYSPVHKKLSEFDPFTEENGGIYVLPGEYNVSIYASEKGEVTQISDKKTFSVKALDISNFNAPERAGVIDFQKDFSKLARIVINTGYELEDVNKEIARLKQVNLQSSSIDPDINHKLIAIEHETARLILKLNGYEAKASDEEIPPAQVSILKRLYYIINGSHRSSEPPTETQKQNFAIVQQEFAELKADFEKLSADVKTLKEQIEN